MNGEHRARVLRGVIVNLVRTKLGWPAFRRLPLSPLERWHRVRRAFAPDRYTTARPFTLRSVDPAEIELSLLESAPRLPQWGHVVDGDWEEQAEPFRERAIPRGIEQRFEEGLPWRETALWSAFTEQLARFGVAWGYTDPGEFEQRCRDVDRLYESIRSAGYLTQEELTGAKYPTTLQLDEINVDVGREGELYWRCCGQHRLAIAQLLDLDRIPVLVHRRHARWENTRRQLGDERARSGSAADDHPDTRPMLRGE